jgi:wobble nucleotide-excising tRNase
MIKLIQDRGLFSLIIGEEGVRLAKLLERFNAHVKVAATKLKDAEVALKDDLPSDITREAFFALMANPAHAERLESAEKALKAVQQAEKILALKEIEKIPCPGLPKELQKILAATLPDIDASARDRLAHHFRTFKLGKQGEAWINYGIDHIHDEACPFCARPNADELGMVSLYTKIFGEQYKAHIATIAAVSDDLENALGESVRTAITTTLNTNFVAFKVWLQYIQLKIEIPKCIDIGEELACAHIIVKKLIERKRQSPLEPVEEKGSLEEASAIISRVGACLAAYNNAVANINATIRKNRSASTITEDAAKLAVTNAKRRIARTEDPGVQGRIEKYLAAGRRDERAKNARKATQTKLKDANEAAAGHYHVQVNTYLKRFGVKSSISRPTNSMVGNAGSSDYSLLIRGVSVPRGRGHVTAPIPSFSNTLSTGDKTTLALAFFLAKLDRDSTLNQKIVVFDDPLSSHDSHRRGKTIEAIQALSGRCRQVIILSHDEYFLRDLEENCLNFKKSSYQIEYSGGDEWSTANAVNLKKLCRTDHAKRIDKLVTYTQNRVGDPDDIILHVRQVIETHFRRSYTAYFAHNRNLGQMVWDIDTHVGAHPCARVRDRMDTLNKQTCDNHHGDDADVMPKKGVDPDALKVLVEDALELIGARRPAGT